MRAGKYFLSAPGSRFLAIGPAKITENRPTDKFFMTKMNLNRNFELAMEIIHEIFIECKYAYLSIMIGSQISISIFCHFIMI